MADNRNDSAGYLGWFLLGGVSGVAAALMLAPKAGREIRDQLIERGGELARRAQELAQGRAGDWIDKSREVFEEQTQRLMSAFEAGKDAMRDEMRKGNTPPRGRGRAPESRGAGGATRHVVQPSRRSHHRHLRRRARHRLPERQQRDEGHAPRPAAVLRPVGLLPGQGHPRAPLSRAGAGDAGGAGRHRRRARPAAGEAAGARDEVRRGGEALQRREEGHREGRQEARARARLLPHPRSLLRVRRGVPPDRDRLLVRRHPGHLTRHVRLLDGRGRARRPQHAERLFPLRARGRAGSLRLLVLLFLLLRRALVDALLELVHGFAERARDLRQLAAPEQHEHDHQNDQQLLRPQTKHGVLLSWLRRRTGARDAQASGGAREAAARATDRAGGATRGESSITTACGSSRAGGTAASPGVSSQTSARTSSASPPSYIPAIHVGSGTFAAASTGASTATRTRVAATKRLTDRFYGETRRRSRRRRRENGARRRRP